MNLQNELLNNKVYNRKELTDFIIALESKYNIVDETEKFSYLVNFSNNLNTPYHKWFRYREGFAGKLVQDLILKSGARKGELIIDPFCGSGTVPVVSMLNGYAGLGIDINPLSAFITEVKTRFYSEGTLIKAVKFLEEMKSYKLDEEKIDSNDVKKFFHEATFNKLSIIKCFIDALTDKDIKDLFLLSFICIIEICSNRRRDGNGLKTLVSQIKDINAVFRIKLLEIISDIREEQPEESNKCYSFSASATDLYSIYSEIHTSDNLNAGAIIFSPPYANSFNYFESYKMELVMGGFVSTIRSMKTLRSKAVRSFIGVKEQKNYDYYVDLIAKEIEESVPIKEKETGKRDNRTRKVPNMIKGYFYDMDQIIEQCSFVLEKGKRCYIVIDQSSYLGKVIPSDLLFAYIGEKHNFEVSNILVCRKAMTSAQQLKKYPYLKNILRESIVELIKL